MTDLREPAEPDYGTAEEAERRFREDEELDRLDHNREMAFHLSDPKPAPRVKRTNAPRPDRLWKERVLERDQGCCVHSDPADCDEGWAAHHVVPQQRLRREAPEYLWNIGVGMGTCGLAHRQHHSGKRPIRRDEIPVSVVSFLFAAGFAAYLDRHYPSPVAAPSERA